MKIKLLSSVAIAGTVRKPGDEVEVEKVVGNDLIHRKRAVLVGEPKQAGVITSESLTPEAPKRRGRPPANASSDNNDAGNADE